jgi:predicted TIM-barrel fold metal-dependent hydrolase
MRIGEGEAMSGYNPEAQVSAAPPLVDSHAHIWSEAMPFARDAWTRPNYAFPVEKYIAALDAHGVGYGVVAAASLFGTYNDYTISALRQHNRLRGTAIVKPTIGLHELEAMKADGIVGIRLQLFHVEPLPDFTGDAYNLLFHRLRDLDMHVHINTEASRLGAVIAALRPSGVKIVIDHFGWPQAEAGLECPGFQISVEACRAGRAWVKLSSGFRRPDQDISRNYAQAYVDQVGTDRLFWGSDAPFVGHEGLVSYADTIRQYEYWLPDDAIRSAISQTTYDFYFGESPVPDRSVNE